MRRLLDDIINHPTRTLMRYAKWVNDRVSEDVIIGILCVAGLIAVLARIY